MILHAIKIQRHTTRPLVVEPDFSAPELFGDAAALKRFMENYSFEGLHHRRIRSVPVESRISSETFTLSDELGLLLFNRCYQRLFRRQPMHPLLDIRIKGHDKPATRGYVIFYRDNPHTRYVMRVDMEKNIHAGWELRITVHNDSPKGTISEAMATVTDILKKDLDSVFKK